MKATYKERTVKVGYQDVPLEAGEFIFGRHTASKETKISEQTIRTCIKHLEKMGNLTIKSTKQFSIISIVNWSRYQEESTNEPTNSQPTTNQRLTTNKKGKKDKKDKKDIYGKFLNVSLTEEQCQSLKEKFNSSTDEKIEKLSEYKESKGIKYKSDYATILSWERRDKEKQPKETVIEEKIL